MSEHGSGYDHRTYTDQSLQEAGIIDDVVDDFKPSCFILPYYGSQKTVTLGNTLKKSETKEAPSVKVYCPGNEDIKGLTVALTDPDAPSRENPKWSEMCHWIATLSDKSSDPTDSAVTFELDGLDDVVECR